MARSVFQLDTSQRKELTKYWFGLSQIVVGSMIVKLFESGAPTITIGPLLIILAGLTIALFLVILGLRFAKGDT